MKQSDNHLRSKPEHQDVGINFINLVENAIDGILVIVGKGIIAYANPFAAAMVGKTKEAVIGRSIKEFLHPDECERVWNFFWKRMSGESAPDRYSTVIIGQHSALTVELTVAKTTWSDEPASFVIIRTIDHP